MTNKKGVSVEKEEILTKEQIEGFSIEEMKDFSFYPQGIDENLLANLNDLISRFQEYSHQEDTKNIRDAFLFAYKAHITQRRKSGEQFIIHPLETANILVELEMDQDTLLAALLHDTVEDNKLIELSHIEELFGESVAVMVGGVTKLGRIPYSSRVEEQAENMRKMFLSMAKDIRVVIIKLADRLHNMRTLKHQKPEKQVEIANETIEIYAPLAHRLGIYKIKWELEDLCLRYLKKDAYYELVGSISQKRSDREEFMTQVINDLYNKIGQKDIKAEIEGRPKHFYSIYNKMQEQDKSLDQIYDLFACRIIVETVSDCYAVLGIVHDTYYPMPGRFKDYIAMPKPNMYQSLHTTVIGRKGTPFEVQIRTMNMHRTAEYGIAAHWRYKEGGYSKDSMTSADGSLDMKLSWLRQLLEWQRDSKDAGEYMDDLKNGLQAEEVFVFTPKGDVVPLPSDSVPIDFAYYIHSGIGNHMYGAKVNGRNVPLTYKLENGDIVEVLTSEKVQGPSQDWMKIVKSNNARSKIRHWFKLDRREENVSRGKEILEREMKKTGFTVSQLTGAKIIEVVLKKNSCSSLEDLQALVGYGDITPAKIVGRLKIEYVKSLSKEEQFDLGYRVTTGGRLVEASKIPIVETEQSVGSPIRPISSRKEDMGVVVKGIDNCLIHISRCCSPVPGDSIIGYVTRGKGVGIHRVECSNIRNIMKNAVKSSEAAERAARLIDVYWRERGEQDSFQVGLTILAHDRTHLLGDISNAIADEKASIIKAAVHSMKDVTANFQMTIEIKNQNQYDRIVGRIKAIQDVFEVRRGH